KKQTVNPSPLFLDSELFVQPVTKLAEQLGVKDEPLPHLGLLCFFGRVITRIGRLGSARHPN
ncbi:MAG: hypothetical protein AAGF54_16470, partial [Pseudomonadota bacterium]